VRKIGDVTSGPFEIERVLVEKRIEFGDKRRDFAWLRACYALGAPRANTLQVLGQLGKRPQAKPNLKHDATDEREGAERQRDRGHGLAQRTPERMAGSRGGNNNSFVPDAEPLRANAQRFVFRSCPINCFRPSLGFRRRVCNNEIVGSQRG
jgi:hypothetical protein